MDDARELLESARVIAVVGCSDKPWRDSNRIAEYLRAQGYRVYAVNPTIERCNGERTWPSVASIPEHVDVVDVFRRPEFVPDVVDDAIAAGADAIWLQLGVGNPEAERRAAEAGMEVISDRCIMVEHKLLRIAPRSART